MKSYYGICDYAGFACGLGGFDYRSGGLACEDGVVLNYLVFLLEVFETI